MSYKHRVTVRVTCMEGFHGSLTSSRIVYADDTQDLINPLDTVLDGFRQTNEAPESITKSKKK